MEKENAYKKINKIKQILLIIIFLLIIWIIGIIAGTYYFNLSNNKKENGGEISGINKGLQANTSTYVYEFSDVETINSISFKFKVTAKDLLESNPKIGEEYNLSVLDHKIVIPYITYYKVMTGDTIESISEKFDVEPNVLYDINIINRIDTIATAFLSTVLVPYQGLLVAYEKFNITAIFDILSSILKNFSVDFLRYTIFLASSSTLPV